jgi:hypothetical protein
LSRVQKVKDKLEKAHQIQDSTTHLYRVWQDQLRSDIANIKNNEEYSAKGKEKLVESLKSRKTIEFLKGARQQQSEFRKYMSEAKKESEAIIYAKTPAVDSEKMDRFTKRFGEVKTEIKLATSARRGKEILQEFLGSIDEQGLAVIVKEGYGDLIQPILDGAGGDLQRYKNDLGKSFEQVKTRALDPEAVEAFQVVDYVEAALNSKFYSPMVEQNVQQTLGKLAATYMEKPDEYFETFAEIDKPQSHLRSIIDVLEEEDAKKL